jgi:hypothetical protein
MFGETDEIIRQEGYALAERRLVTDEGVDRS